MKKKILAGALAFLTAFSVLTGVSTKNANAFTGWSNQNGNWYYYNGSIQTGWLQQSSKWYYLNSNGVMSIGWQQIKETWYYFYNSGEMATGWLNQNGTWYYLDSSGAMATGWKYINGSWYYMNNSGAMKTGWLSLNDSWYYLNSNGSMKTGWLQQGNTWYYLNDSGAMATGTITIGNEVHRFDTNGIWLGKVDTYADLKVHYIDVGQADSELIQVGGKNILIDAGCNDNKTLNYLKSINVTKLDYVIATHPHEDHIGGMTSIINNFTVDNFYAPKVTHTTKTFENMINALKTKNLKINTPTVGDTLTIGDATMQFLAPNSNSYDNLNNYSIVTKLKYGNNSFIFMGDAESLSEGEILAKQLDIQADVLKVGHHGSKSSTSESFLKSVNPKYAIISCGKDNDYGHPHKETMDKLKNKGIKLFKTDEQGTIIATSNGINISFNVGDYTNPSITQEVYVTKGGTAFHKTSTCSNMKNPILMNRQDAIANGYKPCSKCHP